ncbi:MAG: ABC transporter ATP-binding protein [Deltaproteobacteria bacterium]|nr:ABC transporter ATP-binding protein [Deltaproteobacteria bacterium]
MSEIKLVNINKHICRDLNLKIEHKEVFVIVGTTGAGKTTLLNVIAGVTDYKGNVLIDGVEVDNLQPSRRGVGYLFQDLALFPHLTVESNIAFGLRASGLDKDALNERVSYLMEMMRIKSLARRYPDMLSGGEKKRVALARSLAPSPGILLLDEPTSNLDHQTSKYLRSELKALFKDLNVTTIYVTHNLREAEEIADRIALMSDGEIEQVSSPKELFFNPFSTVVSEFIGMPNIIECKKSRVLASGLVEVSSDDMNIILPYDGINIRKIAISPDNIYISDKKPPGPALNRFVGRVDEITRHNAMVRVRVSVGKNSLLAELPAAAFDEMSIEEGKEVHVLIKLRRLRYVEA